MADHRFRVFKRGSATRAVILRMPQSEYAEIEVLADQADIGVSTVCKQLIRQALSRGVVVVEEEQQPKPIAPEEQLQALDVTPEPEGG